MPVDFEAYADLPWGIAHGLEQFMMDWKTIPWDEVPEEMKEFKDEEGPIGAGKHPQFGWFVLAAGQGPLILWCETPPDKLRREFKDYRPLGGSTPKHEDSRKCHCGKDAQTKYNEEFDAIYCVKCNNWIEGKCSDPHCEFCHKRPDRPMPVAS